MSNIISGRFPSPSKIETQIDAIKMHNARIGKESEYVSESTIDSEIKAYLDDVDKKVVSEMFKIFVERQVEGKVSEETAEIFRMEAVARVMVEGCMSIETLEPTEQGVI